MSILQGVKKNCGVVAILVMLNVMYIDSLGAEHPHFTNMNLAVPATGSPHARSPFIVYFYLFVWFMDIVLLALALTDRLKSLIAQLVLIFLVAVPVMEYLHIRGMYLGEFMEATDYLTVGVNFGLIGSAFFAWILFKSVRAKKLGDRLLNCANSQQLSNLSP